MIDMHLPFFEFHAPSHPGNPLANGRADAATPAVDGVELLENVLRHSSTGDTTLNIRISLPESVVWVETTNQATPDNIAELRRLAILGLGICFLPRHCAEHEVAAGRLWPLTPERCDWKVDIFLITNPAAPRPSLRNLFVSELHAVKSAVGQGSAGCVS